jgi:hypothetical protein
MVRSLLLAAVVCRRAFRTSSDRSSKPRSVAAYERREIAHTVHTETTKGLIRISNFAQSITGATERRRSNFSREKSFGMPIFVGVSGSGVSAGFVGIRGSLSFAEET